MTQRVTGGQPTVANLWEHYLPKSYVEAHPFLADGTHGVRSIVLGNFLYDNGNPQDGFTYCRKKDKTLQELRLPSLWQRARNRLTRKQSWRQFNKFCIEQIERREVSILHAHFGTTGARLLPAIRRSKLPTVVSFYGVDINASFGNQRWADAYRELFDSVDRVLTLCEPIIGRLEELGCPRHKAMVYSLPAGIEKYTYHPRVPSERVRFIMAARFIPKKGHSLVLKAFSNLIQMGKKADLTLIGYGNILEQIQTEIADLRLTDRVRIIDTQAKPDFATLYDRELVSQHIFVHPSITASNWDMEGGPALTQVCAQAAGLPVICTRYPGAEQVTFEGENGLFCEANVESLTEKMLYLTDRPELWTPWGKRGKEIVEGIFSQDGQIKKLAETYKGVLKERAH